MVIRYKEYHPHQKILFHLKKENPARKSETSKEIFWCGNAESARRWRNSLGLALNQSV